MLHQPVLLLETMDALQPESGGVYADLTLGGGGHAEALLERSSPDGFLLGLDQDPEILVETRRFLEAYKNRTRIEQGNFRKASRIFEAYLGSIDGVIMDLGLSSFQLDRACRGFSLFKDGPLDLRMDTTLHFTGQDLVNRGQPEELLHAVGVLGEEPKAKAIVKAILEERQVRPLLHTFDIRRIVEKVYGRKGGRIHPATRTFQGLRMTVNEEVESLGEGLQEAFRLLKKGGRLAVISFHSGEDRIVKVSFKEQAGRGGAGLLTRKPIRPGADEVRRNRRSRSARLRVLEKA